MSTRKDDKHKDDKHKDDKHKDDKKKEEKKELVPIYDHEDWVHDKEMLKSLVDMAK
jgi:hypothetical protein